MPYNDNGLSIYIYGQDDAPVGAGKGEQLYPTIKNEALETGKKFEDPHFPATYSSLNIEDAKNVEWHRPDEIAKAIFPDAPEPLFHRQFDEFAVSQGSVGDCWFLAALADIATKPDCISTVVPADNDDDGFAAGAFHFRFWCRGKWVDISIDDRLPCVLQNGKISGTYSVRPTKTSGFWAALLEKAYAKMYGSYKNIVGGYGVDAMMDFTGGFIQSYSAKDKPDFPHIIKEAHEQNALMSMQTKFWKTVPQELRRPHDPKNPGYEHQTVDGMVLGHVYSILSIREVQDKVDPTKKYTLLKLRNPWGNSAEFDGDFSDKDSKNKWATVSEDLRRPASTRRNDGEFWMPFESLVPYLQQVDICRWSATYRGEIEKEETINGWSIKSTKGYFTKENSGALTNAADGLAGKPCFYAHLKPVNPNEKEELKNGYNYNCGVSITMEFLNYKQSDTDDNIPCHGFYINWAPGYGKPDLSFLQKALPAEHAFVDNRWTRRSMCQKNLPEGTLQIVPWIPKPPTSTDIPYLLRIAVEGQIFTYDVKA